MSMSMTICKQRCQHIMDNAHAYTSTHTYALAYKIGATIHAASRTAAHHRESGEDEEEEEKEEAAGRGKKGETRGQEWRNVHVHKFMHVLTRIYMYVRIYKVHA